MSASLLNQSSAKKPVLLRTLLQACALLVLITAITALYLSSKEARNDYDFQTSYQQLASSHIDGDNIEISQMRDFRYKGNGEILAANYINRHYSLSELSGVWLGISHFGDYGLAHTFLSFEFTPRDGSAAQYLVTSIEARLKADQASYSPVTGLFRNYMRMVVLATEEDVIGVRTHHRQESVYLYPLNFSATESRALLLSLLNENDYLSLEADFYNTFSDNCLLGLIKKLFIFQKQAHTFDYRTLLPGYFDELAYELNLIQNNQSFNTLKQRALIEAAAIPEINPQFSTAIRAKWPSKSK